MRLAHGHVTEGHNNLCCHLRNKKVYTSQELVENIHHQKVLDTSNNLKIHRQYNNMPYVLHSHQSLGQKASNGSLI